MGSNSSHRVPPSVSARQAKNRYAATAARAPNDPGARQPAHAKCREAWHMRLSPRLTTTEADKAQPKFGPRTDRHLNSSKPPLSPKRVNPKFGFNQEIIKVQIMAKLTDINHSSAYGS